MHGIDNEVATVRRLRFMNSESVIPLEAPTPSMGAPIPTLVANDFRMSFAYFVEQAAIDAPEAVAIVRAKNCILHKFGAPDENVILGHKLFRSGLEAISTAEVMNSEWIVELKQMAKRSIAADPLRLVHHSPPSYSASRHFIFAFHDSTLEFVAEDIEVEMADEALHDVIHRLIDELAV